MQQEWQDTWYLLRCRENAWKKTLSSLNELAGIKTCCPMITEKRRRSDKKFAFRQIDYPAFPGYIFVSLNPEVTHPTHVKRVPGAMDFVRFGKEMAVVGNKDISALSAATPSVISADEHQFSCINLPEELKTEVEMIYATQDPKLRVFKLLALIASHTEVRKESFCTN
jgi:transcriptional antiterminator RfaH